MFAIQAATNNFPKNVYDFIDADIAAKKYNIETGIGKPVKFDEVDYRTRALLRHLLATEQQIKILREMINSFLSNNPGKCIDDSVKIRQIRLKVTSIPNQEKK